MTTKTGVIKEIVNGATSLALLIAQINKLFREHKYLVVSIRLGRDRSAEQNRLWAGMYKRLVQNGIFESEAEAKSYCKYRIGKEILYRDCEKFKAGWDRFFANESYEIQLYLMGNNGLFEPDGFPVTRLLGRKQGCEYTKSIADHPYFVENNVSFEDLLSDD